MSDNNAKMGSQPIQTGYVGPTGHTITTTDGTGYYGGSPIYYDEQKWNGPWNFPKAYIPCPISSLDEEGKMKMNHNNIHIQPANNGFIVNIFTKEDGLKVYCFSNFKEVLTFLNDLAIMDIDSEEVAENV